MRERNVATASAPCINHFPKYAAARPRLLQGSAQRKSSAWVDGWMAHRRRSPCAFSCQWHIQIIDPGDVNAHLRRTDDGSAQRSRMGGAAVTVVGT